MKKILLVTLLASIVSLTGCETTRQNAMTGETENSASTIGTVGGCIGGAIIGGIINNGKGAAIGCAAGGGAGYLVGANMDKQESALRQELTNSGVQIERIGDKIKLIFNGDITFNKNEATLNPSVYRSLNSIVKVMNEYPKTTLLIEGHTDSDGSATYNKELSEFRALSVQKYLNVQGLSRNRTEAVGLGKMFPKCDNKTVAGKTCNRRVELTIVSN